MLKSAFILTASLILSLSSAATGALAKGDAHVDNPFGGIIGCFTGSPPDLSKFENVSSPFAEDHFYEQDAYAYLYDGKYWTGIRCAKIPQRFPADRPLPRDVDADGHPLWFGGTAGYARLSAMAHTLLLDEHYDALDRLFLDWSNLSERTADGAHKLFAFGGVITPSHRGETRETVYQKVRTWRSRSPSSVAAAVAEALYWLDYADDARGEGSAGTVTPVGWALYDERARKAEAVLRESQPYTRSNPYWAPLMIRAGRSLNWPKERLLALFRTQPGPQFVGSSSLAVALTPKWGGSWRLVEDFARETAEKNRSAQGNGVYAGLYVAISNDYNGIDPNIFRYTLANWADMKRSFVDRIHLYPHSAGILNDFAAFACMADDKATFQGLRYLIGKTVVPSSWPPGYSLDVCEHKFALQPL